MRLAAPLAIAVLAAALLGGCGSGDGSGSSMTTNAAPKADGSSAPAGASARECDGGGALRATGLPCKEAHRLKASWERSEGCAPGAGDSRSACTIEGDYRCLSVVTEKGISVSCARPGRSIAFTAKRG